VHILFLTDNFPPEVNAPASRTFEHCREWVKSGHKVTVITCAPNFPKGHVYEGYQNKIWQSADIDGIRVIRVWSYIAANEGFVKRILDYLSYMFMSVLAAPFVRKVDVVVGTSPQFFTACAAYIVSRYKFVPFIFELRDLWPESIKTVGAMKDSFLIRVLEKIEYFLYRKAKRIVSVTNSFKNVLVKNGVEVDKIDVITNGVDLERFYPVEKDEDLVSQYQLKDSFVAGYIGTHGMAHALDTLLRTAEKLQSESGEINIKLVLLGDGANKKALLQEAKQKKLKNIIFIDSVDKEAVSRYWSLLDASIIHLKKTDLFKSVIPSKLFESMGMGIPILLGVQGESAEIVNNNHVGMTFEPENEDELVESLKKLHKNNNLYGDYRDACITTAKAYDRKYLANEMLKVIVHAAGK